MNQQACVYRILNTTTGECYIGGTSHIHNRSQCHKSFLKNGNHPNKRLQESFNKYGVNHFRLEILELVNDIDTLEEREQYYYNLLNPEFCIRSFVNSNAGIKMSEESSIKKHKAMFGHRRSDEERKAVSANKKGINNHAYGKPARNRGTTHSDESKKKISDAKRRMNFEIAEEIRRLYASGLSTTLLAEKYNLSCCTISGIINNKTYKKKGGD